MASHPRPRLPLIAAPVLAGLFTAVLYSFRVDSVFYFLHGSEAQALLLAQALADGMGFVDLSLPGNPAHVREPPLFYLILAAVIKVKGLDLAALKIVMWAGYVAAAVFAALLFQRRTRPWLGLAAVMLVMASPELFRLFTGPKSDLPYAALSFAALLAIEALADAVLPSRRSKETPAPGRNKIIGLAAIAAVLIAASIFMRSLGMALVFALAGALVMGTKGRGAKGRAERLRAAAWAIAVIAPVILAVGLWSARSIDKSGRANYTYLDWFLMDLAPDSPEMMAVDFHAPLMDRVPRGSPAAAMKRALHHAVFYPAYSLSALTGLARAGASASAILALLAAVAAWGLVRCEQSRPPAVALYLLAYLGVVLIWPMDDPRLLLPVLPFLALYLVEGARDLALRAAAKIAGPSRAPAIAAAVTSLAGAALIVVHLAADQDHARAVSRLPTTTMAPGFEVRFLSREQMESYQALVWARDHLPREAVLMYHSTPPCRLVSGHACSPIPFNGDLARVRAYVRSGPAGVVVADGFGQVFPAGPGLFVERMIKPLLRAHPEDFSELWRAQHGTAAIYRINRPGAPPP